MLGGVLYAQPFLIRHSWAHAPLREEDCLAEKLGPSIKPFLPPACVNASASLKSVWPGRLSADSLVVAAARGDLAVDLGSKQGDWLFGMQWQSKRA